MRKALAGAVIAALAVLTPVAGAAAAPGAVTPDHGPVTGGTTVTVPAPEDVKYTSLGGGGNHSVAIGSDGNTYAWGYGTDGRLGNGAFTSSMTPVRVATPEGVTFTSIHAGTGHTLAFGSDGNLYAWGQNGLGELGNGTTDRNGAPVQVLAPADGVTFTGVSPSHYHSLAIGSDGNAYAWGQSAWGVLGIETGDRYVTRATKINTPEDVRFSSVSAGYMHSLAIDAAGNAYGWGYNIDGRVGDTSTTERATPVPVGMPTDVTFTSIGAGQLHSVALGADGVVYAWGDSSRGAFGDDGVRPSTAYPIPVPAPEGVSFENIQVGYSHILAGGSDGRLYEWGSNRFTEDLINLAPVPKPVDAPEGITFTSWTAGFNHSFAIGSDGNTYAWGLNAHGQLGLGDKERRTVPERVQSPVQVTSVSFDGVPATEFTHDHDTNTITAVTTEHEEGPVDVTVEWTLAGEAQEPLVHKNGYTYEPLPVEPTIVSDPEDVTVEEGQPASFEVTATGTPEPAVTWEYSEDDGETWQPVTASRDIKPAKTSNTLTIAAAALESSGTQFRATATNIAGDSTSEPATLTVTEKDDDGNGDNDGNNGDDDTDNSDGKDPGSGGNANSGGNTADPTPAPVTTTSLSNTGSGANAPLLVAGAAALILGAAALTLRLARRHRASQQ